MQLAYKYLNQIPPMRRQQKQSAITPPVVPRVPTYGSFRGPGAKGAGLYNISTRGLCPLE